MRADLANETEYDSESRPVFDSLFDRLFHIGDHYVNRIEKKLDALSRQAGREWTVSNSLPLNAAGNLTMYVYDNAEGYATDLTRVIVWVDGYTPATVYQSASCYGFLAIGVPSFGAMFDYFPTTPGGVAFPAYAEYQKDSHPILRMNDRLVLQVNNGPPNANLTCMVFGRKWKEIHVS